MSAFVGKIQQYITARETPYWIRNGYGGKFLQSLGLTLDTAQGTLLHVLRQTRPLVAFADALPFIGADRNIRRYPTEPEDSYRARLARWRQIKRHAGSHYGEMLNLQPFFLPNVLPALVIVHQAGDGSSATYHRLSPEGVYTVTRAVPSNYAWDPNDERWSRFWLFIEETAEMVASAPALYDDGTIYDSGVTLYDGGVFSNARIDDIVALVNDSKAAHSMLAGVGFIRAGYSLTATGTAVTLPDGSTTYPTGNWFLEADHVTGLPTRPEFITFLYVNPEA